MTDTWAAKVLEGVPRLALETTVSGEQVIVCNDGPFIRYNLAISAIAKLSEGDGLVERLLAERSVISTTRTFPSGDERDMVLVPQYGPNLLATEAAAHIAALKAQVEEWQADSAAAWDNCEERRIAQEAAEARIAELVEECSQLEAMARGYAEELAAMTDGGK